MGASSNLLHFSRVGKSKCSSVCNASGKGGGWQKDVQKRRHTAVWKTWLENLRDNDVPGDAQVIGAVRQRQMRRPPGAHFGAARNQAFTP